MYLELASYLDRADFKARDDVTWTLMLQFLEVAGGGAGYQFTADFVASAVGRTVSHVTVRVPDAAAYPRDRVLASLHERLTAGTLAEGETITLANEAEGADGGGE